MMVRACDPRTWEAEAGEWAPGQPELYSETLTQKTKPRVGDLAQW